MMEVVEGDDGDDSERAGGWVVEGTFSRPNFSIIIRLGPTGACLYLACRLTINIYFSFIRIQLNSA